MSDIPGGWPAEMNELVGKRPAPDILAPNEDLLEIEHAADHLSAHGGVADGERADRLRAAVRNLRMTLERRPKLAAVDRPVVVAAMAAALVRHKNSPEGAGAVSRAAAGLGVDQEAQELAARIYR